MEFILPFTELSINLYIVFFGIVVGCLAATFGIGGGFLVVPVLNLVFGIPPAYSVGSSLAQMVPTSLFGLVPHWRKGNVIWQVPAVFFLGAAPGIEIGAFLVETVKERSGTSELLGHIINNSQYYLLGSLTAVFLLQGSFMLYESVFIPKTGNGEPGKRFLSVIRVIKIPPYLAPKRGEFRRFPFLTFMFVGFLGGISIGFLGLGGGFVAVPVFIYLVGLDTKKAVGSSMLLVFIAASWGMFRHAISGRENVEWGIAAAIVIGSLLGTQIGARINAIAKPQNIRKYLGFIIITTGVLIWVGFFLKLLLA